MTKAEALIILKAFVWGFCYGLLLMIFDGSLSMKKEKRDD